MMPSQTRLPPGADRIPILGPKPSAAQPPRVPVVAAIGGGLTRASARESAFLQIGAGSVNVAPMPSPVFLPPGAALEAPEDVSRSPLGALGINTPAHPMWGGVLRALVAVESTDDPETWVAACIGWVQAIVEDGPTLGGVMVAATSRAPTQDEARVRAEQKMEDELRSIARARGMPDPERAYRITAAAGLDPSDPDQTVRAASALVLAAFALQSW